MQTNSWKDKSLLTAQARTDSSLHWLKLFRSLKVSNAAVIISIQQWVGGWKKEKMRGRMKEDEGVKSSRRETAKRELWEC